MFEFATFGYAGLGRHTIEVDGVPTNADSYVSAPAFDFKQYYHQVELPASIAARRIRLTTANKPFGGIAVATASTVAAAPVANPSSIVFVGDSITEGIGATAVWRTWVAQAASRLGIDNPVMSGVGGSGYLAALGKTPGTQPRLAGVPDNTLRDRTDDVLRAIGNATPDAVVIAAGINDSPFTNAQVEAEAQTYFEALRSGAPTMAMIVLGPFSPCSGYEATLTSRRDAIFRAASRVARVSTVDTSGWVTAANRDTIFNTSDRTHPNDTGHAVYGELAAAAIAPIIRAL